MERRRSHSTKVISKYKYTRKYHKIFQQHQRWSTEHDHSESSRNSIVRSISCSVMNHLCFPLFLDTLLYFHWKTLCAGSHVCIFQVCRWIKRPFAVVILLLILFLPIRERQNNAHTHKYTRAIKNCSTCNVLLVTRDVLRPVVSLVLFQKMK